MNTIFLITGLALVLIGVIDIFMTIVYYEGSEFISSKLQRLFWVLVKKTGAIFPLQIRYILFSFGAPLMIILTLGFWIGIEIFGFALIFFVGIEDKKFIFNLTDNSNSFLSALYFSSVTLPTLGFGDITPTTFFYQTAAAIESLIGFAVMTLSLSYILNIYKVIQQFRVLSSELYHDTSNTGDINIMLVNQWYSSKFIPGDSYFQLLQHSLLDWFENMHQYPLAYYYFSSRPYLSIPFTFKIIGEILSANYFCIPSAHPLTHSPELKSLYNSYIPIMTSILHLFSKKHIRFAKPIGYSHFVHYLISSEIPDASLNNFFLTVNTMKRLTGITDKTKYLELYRQYCLWLTFSSQVQQFTDFTSNDLGYTN